MHDKFCKELGNVHYGAEPVEENIDSEQDDSVAVKTHVFGLEEQDSEQEDDVAVKTHVFGLGEQDDAEFYTFCKPIRTPRQNQFFGIDAYNAHPLQKEDR
ncbi:MAG: hypothetical protein IJB90_00815 [Clostridia bacterium]|nr:hypothetical protein [Clostridia bacterium]